MFLLDKRPAAWCLVWCDAETGEPHSECKERRIWNGTAGGVAADNGDDESQEEEEEEKEEREEEEGT